MNRDRMILWLDGAEFAVWTLLFAGLPLFVLPSTYDSFLLPKFQAAEMLMALGAAIALTATLLGRPLRVALQPALFALIAFAIWQGISTFWSASPSLSGDAVRFWGWTAATGVFVSSFFAYRRRWIPALGVAILCAAFATAIWALADDAAATYFNRPRVANKLGDWRGFIAAGFGNTSHIADFLALTFPAAFLAAMKARPKWAALWIVWIAVVYAALIDCFSVHSNSGLILAMLVLLILLARRRGLAWFQRRRGRLTILVALWLGIAAFFSFDVPGNPRAPGVFRVAFASDRLAFGWDSRVFIWLTGLDMVREHAWLGIGAGAFEYVFPTTHSALVLNDPNLWQMAGSWTNAAHNSLLQAWTELGIPGPALLILMFVFAVRAFAARVDAEEDGWLPEIRLSCLAALTAFAVHAQMNFPLQMPPASMWWMLMIALSAALLPRPADAEGLPDIRLQYRWGGIRIEPASFKRPRAIGIVTRALPMWLWIASVALIAIAAAFPVAGAAKRIGSDIAYRRAHEMRTALEQGRAISPRRIDEAFQQALDLWPRRHDARSSYSEFLLRQGKFEAGLKQADLALERLTAWELHLRRARALWRLERFDEARHAAARAFEIYPVQAMIRPRLASWAAGEIPREQAPPPEPGLPTEAWGMQER